MCADAAYPENRPFDNTTEKDGKPEDVHRPTARDSISCGMEGPPEHAHSHDHEENSGEQADEYCYGRGIVRFARADEPTLEAIEGTPGEPCSSAFDVGDVIV